MELVPEEIEEYAASHSTQLDPLLAELEQRTKTELPDRAGMLSGQVEGLFLQMLVASLRAKRVLEIGCFTGLSALMMAKALPPDGTLITCDIEPKHIAIARDYFRRSPDGAKIELREGPALETLATLAGPFDFVFIDADKRNYLRYYEAALPLLAPNGLIAVDNVLWSDRVLDPKEPDDHAMAEFNDRVQSDARVTNTLLTVRDGVMLIRRR